MGEFIDAPDDFDPDAVDVDGLNIVDVRSRSESAINAAVRAYQQELERHLLGAWMAGYDAVDVLTPIGQPPHAGEDVFNPAVPAMRATVRLVDDANQPPQYGPRYRVERYDLRDVDPDEVRAARRGGGELMADDDAIIGVDIEAIRDGITALADTDIQVMDVQTIGRVEADDGIDRVRWTMTCQAETRTQSLDDFGFTDDPDDGGDK